MDIVELSKKLGEFDENKAIKILEKAKKINQKKNVIKNTLKDDFYKGNARNLSCPYCKKKMKKCVCEDV